MPNAFSGISMLGQTMRNFQTGLEVTGHNISNLNTVGYTRQTISYGTNAPDNFWGLNGGYQVGNGMGIQGVYRQRDMFLDNQFRSASSEMGRYQNLSGALQQIQGVFPEPSGSGISDALTKFYDGWSSVASNPSDPASKLQLRLAAETLTSRVRSTYSELQQQNGDLPTQLKGEFDQVDQLTDQIATLNKQIVEAQANGSDANDLLDKRDMAIENLSALVPVQVHADESGSVRLYSGEISLVDGQTSFKIPRQFDAANSTLSDGTHTYKLESGAIAGTLQAGQATKDVLAKLDSLANELRTQINSAHQTGKNAAGTTGISFFNDSNPQTGAADFDLSDDIKASSDNIMSGTSGNAGDGALALSLSRMRDTAVSGLQGMSTTGFFDQVLSTIGRDSSSYSSAIDTSSAVLSQVQNQRQSVSGVNLDEELTNMLKFQRSYQAAAKALSVMDQVTEDLVNLIR